MLCQLNMLHIYPGKITRVFCHSSSYFCQGTFLSAPPPTELHADTIVYPEKFPLYSLKIKIRSKFLFSDIGKSELKFLLALDVIQEICEQRHAWRKINVHRISQFIFENCFYYSNFDWKPLGNVFLRPPRC